jgi:hypothetical protein
MTERIQRKCKLQGHEVCFDRDGLVSRTLRESRIEFNAVAILAVPADGWVTMLPVVWILYARLIVFATAVPAAWFGSSSMLPSARAKPST